MRCAGEVKVEIEEGPIRGVTSNQKGRNMDKGGGTGGYDLGGSDREKKREMGAVKQADEACCLIRHHQRHGLKRGTNVHGLWSKRKEKLVKGRGIGIGGESRK